MRTTPEPRYNSTMHGHLLRPALAVAILTMALAGGQPVKAQNPPAKPPPQQGTARSDQVIRSGVELITTDVIDRDNKGQFISDLKKEDF